MEKQLREAVYAINRAIGNAVDEGISEEEIANVEAARDEVWHIGVRLYGWEPGDNHDPLGNDREEDRIFDSDGTVLGRFRDTALFSSLASLADDNQDLPLMVDVPVVNEYGESFYE